MSVCKEIIINIITKLLGGICKYRRNKIDYRDQIQCLENWTPTYKIIRM